MTTAVKQQPYPAVAVTTQPVEEVVELVEAEPEDLATPTVAAPAVVAVPEGSALALAQVTPALAQYREAERQRLEAEAERQRQLAEQRRRAEERRQARFSCE